MLVELSIRDLALIESLELCLGPGLNAISGETGAGKSLLVGALELLRGESPRGGAAQWIRKGQPEARVDGRFELQGAEAITACLAILEREVPAVAEAWRESLQGDRAELLLGRRLSIQGRSSAHIDQHPVPLRALKALAPHLLEIHGQNEHQRLLLPTEQRRLLDLYGGLGKEVAQHSRAQAELRALHTRRAELADRRADRRDRLDLIRFQVEELRAAELAPGEHASLREERELLRRASELRSELGGLAYGLSESDPSILAELRSALHLVEKWATRLPSIAPALEDLANAEIHVGEAASLLNSVVDGAIDDPERLEIVEERLNLMERLMAKFARDEVGLLELSEEREAEILELEQADESLAELGAAIESAEALLQRAARALHKQRTAVVPGLEKEVQKALSSLGLAKARFDVKLSPPAGFAPGKSKPGSERAEAIEGEGKESHEVVFLLAANPGESPGPLSRVASGGETARIMLALQSVLQSAHGGDGRTLVFDEIDSGVGGRLGPEVAAQLKRLATRSQVLCVTHIPAIAAAAHLHLGTVKEVRKGRTRTEVRRLEGDERVREVADMIAGGAAHETARAEARRLLTESAI